MNFTIKDYKPTDEEKLTKLISHTNGESKLIQITKQSNCILALAAYHQEKMVGIIAAWKTSFHPFCTYFEIVSYPENTVCAEELLAKLEQHLTEKDYPLQTAVYETNAMVDLYRQNNYAIIRKTYLPRINLNQQTIKLEKGTIKSLAEILTYPSLVNQLTSLVKQIYEETHLVNPVAEFNLVKWKKMIFADDLIQEGSFIYLNEKQDEILAYSMLHTSEDKDTVELGWQGTAQMNDIHLINTLVSMQMNYAKNNGYQFMEGEFDTTSPYAMEVLEHFSFPKQPVWVTFQKKES